MIKVDKGLRKKNYIVFLILGVLFWCFFRKYHSTDWQAHVDFSLKLFNSSENEIKELGLPYQSVTYPLFHLSVKLLAQVLSMFKVERGEEYSLAGDFIQTIVVVLSAVAYMLIIRETCVHIRDSKRFRAFEVAVSVIAVIFGVARCELNDWRFYSLQGSPNPFHNPTILMVRPFGLIAILMFFRYVKNYREERTYRKELILFSVFTTISLLAKPSFAFVYLPAMAIETFIQMFREKRIFFGIITFVAVLPALLVVLWQYMFMSGNTSMLSVKIQFGSFSHFTLAQVIAVSLISLPVPIILFSPELLKYSTEYRIGNFTLIIGWCQMFFLTNGPTGDFSWGYDLSIQLATVLSLCAAFDYDKMVLRRKIASAIFLYQFICGLQYLYLLYMNGNFWI